jgi:hypothetical protein
MGRWDHWLEAKAKPLTEHVLDEVAKILAKDLSGWPPPVAEWSSDADRERFASLFAPAAARPGRITFREAFRLARWEMQRDVQAIDQYMTREQWRSEGVADHEFLALLFVHQWLIEQLLGLNEATEGKIKRTQLEDCLDRCERKLGHGT